MSRAKTYYVDIDLRASVAVLSYSEDEAEVEATGIAENVRRSAARAGLQMEIKSVKPRELLRKPI